MVVVVAWAATLGGLFLLTAARAGTTLLTGRAVLGLSVAFLVVELVRWLRAPLGADPTALVVLGAGAAAAFALRGWWILSRYDEDAARATVDEAMRRLRIPGEADPRGWSLRVGETRGRIELRRLPAGRAGLRITCEPPAPKVELLRSLLKKGWDPPVPRPRIRLR